MKSIKVFVLIVCLIATIAIFLPNSVSKTPEMELQARETIFTYLKSKNLPIVNLDVYEIDVSGSPDFSYLYTGGERCIGFVVYCYGNECTEWKKYPYDEHGDKCPITSH